MKRIGCKTDKIGKTGKMSGALAAALLVGPTVAALAGEPGSLSISEKSFRCMTEMTHIGHFYVDNLVGNLDGTVRVAKSTTGGVYPVGSVPSRPRGLDR